MEKTKSQWYHIKRTYGLTPEQYKELDNGKCPLCLRSWSSSVRPCVDHDHHTGYVRGLLCTYCNQRVLGRLSDVSLAIRIVDYLRGQPLNHKVPPKKKRKKRGSRSKS